jgi:hypothetical protein
VVLGAAESLHALARLGRALVDVPGDGRGADEGDRGDAGVVQNRVDGHLVPVHHAEHTVGQACLGVQPGHGVRQRRVTLARLEDEGVPGGNRDRVHPHRHHGREVERGDPGADAERLPERVGVHVGGHLLGVLAFEQGGDPGGELDDFQAPDDLALGVRQDLAVLVRDDPGQFVQVTLDKVA